MGLETKPHKEWSKMVKAAQVDVEKVKQQLELEVKKLTDLNSEGVWVPPPGYWPMYWPYG